MYQPGCWLWRRLRWVGSAAVCAKEGGALRNYLPIPACFPAAAAWWWPQQTAARLCAPIQRPHRTNCSCAAIASDPRSCGGVVVTSADGKIVCSNTLDDRLRITYASNLPDVRALLFGAAA